MRHTAFMPLCFLFLVISVSLPMQPLKFPPPPHLAQPQILSARDVAQEKVIRVIQDHKTSCHVVILQWRCIIVP